MKSITPFVFAGILGVLASCEDYDGYKDDSHLYDIENIDGNKFIDYGENPFVKVSDQPISTFSIDADGASYTMLRKVLAEGRLPDKSMVRIEEMINYFNLKYEFTDQGHPINVNGEIAPCPWQDEHQLVRIGLQGEPLPQERPVSNFVFLIDVSGSMSYSDKLEMLQQGFSSFVNTIQPEDRISIVTYAGSDQILLNGATGQEKDLINQAINALSAGGSTAGADGIRTAYEVAQENFIEGGNNRVILGTDGDFNVGVSSHEELINLIINHRDYGIFLSVLGVGYGNMNDATMEQLANQGNGVYNYIDSEKEMKKVFTTDFGTNFTVAKDVKVQVEFDPEVVEAYRLIGYENRALETGDFEDDSTDAGEMGAGQSVTALYQIAPIDGASYGGRAPLEVAFRYKHPDDDVSNLLTYPIEQKASSFSNASGAMQFTAGVASFGMLLKESSHSGDAKYTDVIEWVKGAEVDVDPALKTELQEVVARAGAMSMSK